MTERFCAVIPALNAARTLAPVLDAVRKQVETVLVVDDGSSDDTAGIAAGGGATVLRHEVNRGKGAALKTAFAWARQRGFDGVVTLDADGQHLPTEIDRLIAAWHETGADLIIGGRSHLFGQMLPRRRSANRFSAWCIAKASGAQVTDSQSGFRLYSRRLLDAVTLHSDGFAMESEVIVRAGRAGFRIMTVPIDMGFVDGLSTSHYKPVKDTLRIAWTVLKTLVFR